MPDHCHNCLELPTKQLFIQDRELPGVRPLHLFALSCAQDVSVVRQEMQEQARRLLNSQNISFEVVVQEFPVAL